MICYTFIVEIQLSKKKMFIYTIFISSNLYLCAFMNFMSIGVGSVGIYLGNDFHSISVYVTRIFDTLFEPSEDNVR